MTAALIDKLMTLWCRVCHRSITRPVNGTYVCLACLRRHEVEW